VGEDRRPSSMVDVRGVCSVGVVDMVVGISGFPSRLSSLVYSSWSR
jgi:hypothetical protein